MACVCVGIHVCVCVCNWQLIVSLGWLQALNFEFSLYLHKAFRCPIDINYSDLSYLSVIFPHPSLSLSSPPPPASPPLIPNLSSCRLQLKVSVNHWLQ